MTENLPQSPEPYKAIHDGPPREIDTSLRRTAQFALTGMRALHAETISEMEAQNFANLQNELITHEPAGTITSSNMAKLTTWVVDENSEYGYALLYRPMPYEGISSEITLYRVSTDTCSNSTILEEHYLAVLTSPTADSKTALIDYMVDELGKEKLNYLSELTDKAFRDVQSGDPEPLHPVIASKLGFHHIEVNPDDYKKLASIGEKAINFSLSIYDDDGLSRVARRRLRASAHEKARKESLYLQYAPMEDENTVYFMRIDGERTPFSSMWNLKRLRLVRQTQLKAEKIDFSPENESYLFEKEGELESDVTGVFSAINDGDEFPPALFEQLWNNPDYLVLKRASN